MSNTNMTEVEIEALKNRISGMSKEEQILAVSYIDTDILWDELRRRELEEREFQRAMTNLVWEKLG